MPFPTALVVKNGSKIRDSTSGGMPGPSSSKRSITPGASARVVMRIVPRPSSASHAFISRFRNTWLSCPAKQRTGGSAP